MNIYRFTLEHYHNGSKHPCPKCHSKSLTLYIDNETNRPLANDVGLCDHISSCGYHKPPKMHFQERGFYPTFNEFVPPIKSPSLIKPTSFISDNIVQGSLKAYCNNNLMKFLLSKFGEDLVDSVLHKYRIGTSKHWPGSTVFWQIDINGRTRTGKIIQYNPLTGKRVKEPFPHITWVHTALKIDDFQLKQCLYGEHLLIDCAKPVALVESEKTAIIASICLPEFTWLATGGLTNLNAQKCAVLKGREVVLFPDLKGYDLWKEKATNLSKLIPETFFKVSDLLEKNATEQEKESGLDIADYLIQTPSKNNLNIDIIQILGERNKLLYKLIDAFDIAITTSHQKTHAHPR